MNKPSTERTKEYRVRADLVCVKVWLPRELVEKFDAKYDNRTAKIRRMFESSTRAQFGR